MYPYDPRYIFGRATMTEYLDADGNAVIPEGVTDIGEKAFLRCAELKTVTIPASVECIMGTAFLFCPELTAIYVSPGNSFLSSADGALYHNQAVLLRCPRGKSGPLEVPEGTRHIDVYAAWSCERLTEVRLPASLRRIDVGAFRGCAALTEVTIPAGVKHVGERAFSRCDRLEEVVILGQETEIAPAAFADCPRLTLYVPAGSPAERYAQESGIPCRAMEA